MFITDLLENGNGTDMKLIKKSISVPLPKSKSLFYLR